MANYSTTTALDGKPVVPNKQKKYSERISLTSPLLRSAKEIRDVFYSRQKYPVGFVKDSMGNLRTVDEPSTAIKTLQVALYLGFKYIDFNRARRSTPLPPLLPNFKNLNSKKFSGLLDTETRTAIYQYQSWYETTRGLSIDSNVGRFTLGSLDYDLELIRYYKWEKFDPMIFHIDSVCEDFHQFTLPHRNNSWLYSVAGTPVVNPTLPSTTDPNYKYLVKKLNQFQSKVNVLRDVSNYNEGWYYVQVFDAALSPKPLFGYLRIEELIPDSNLPEPNANMVPTVLNVTTAYGLIDSLYYTEPGNKNKAGYSLRPEPPSSFSLNYFTELEEYNYFKFYVNLIVYSNNPTGVDNAEGNEVIYLRTLSSEIPDYVPEQLNGSNPNRTGDDNELSNYSYFLKLCKNHGYYWDYDLEVDAEDSIIVIRPNSHIWVPSQIFADRLYAMINSRIDFINEYVTEALDVLKSKWKRGYGIEIEGGLAVKFGFPLKVGAGGKMTISRKFTNTDNEVVLIVKKSGYLSAAFDPSAKEGAAYFVGKGRRLNDERGLYSELKFEAGVEIELSAEYEFELRSVNDEQNDYAAVALLTTCASLISVPTDFLAHEILSLFGAYNIDPFNYMTNVKLTPRITASASASLGLKLFNSDNPDWGAGVNTSSKTYNPYSLGQILSYLQTSIGVSVEGSIEVGALEYSCVYDRDCFGIFGPETRHPKSFELAISVSSKVAADSSLTAGPVEYQFMNSEFSSDLTFRLKFERPFSQISLDPDFSTSYILNNGSPYLELTFGTGSFLGFSENSKSFSIMFRTLTLNSSTDLFDAIEEISIRKRISGKKIKLQFEAEVLQKLTNLLRISAVKAFVSDTSYYEAVLSLKREGGADGTVNEIAPLEVPFNALMNEVQLYLEDKYNEVTNTVMLVVGLPKLATQSSVFKVSSKLYKFLDALYKAMQYESFRFYSETSVGGGAKIAASVGIGFTLDINGSISLVYEKKYLDDRKPVEYGGTLTESNKVINVLKLAPFKNNFTQLKS